MRSKPTFSLFLLLLFFLQTVVGQGTQTNIEEGRKIFTTKTTTNNNTCVSCHNISSNEEFSWNPSAYEIAINNINLTQESFNKKIFKPSSKVSKAAHQSLQLSEQDVLHIKTFLDYLALQTSDESQSNKTLLSLVLALLLLFSFIDLFVTRKIKFRILHISIISIATYTLAELLLQEYSQAIAPKNHITLILILAGLNILSFVDLFFTKKIKLQFLHILVISVTTYILIELLVLPENIFINKPLLVALFFVVIVLTKIDLLFTKHIKHQFLHIFIILVAAYTLYDIISIEAQKVGRSQGYSPDQPIKFSHKTHAGENQIDCKYCHSTAEYSKVANIPSSSTCMNCHLMISEGSKSGKMEIDKIKQAIENDTPIEWIRIHKLPDHVYFSHAQHVGVAEINCQVCHGAVETMDRLEQHSDLSMGWCVDCHRNMKVETTNNAYYQATFVELHKKSNVTPEELGANDCIKCHY